MTGVGEAVSMGTIRAAGVRRLPRPPRLRRFRQDEWDSLDQMRGNMSFGRILDPAAYERANFRMLLR